MSKKVGGLGLGLSIAKENTELLGGELSLKSEKGKGSTFKVTISYKPVHKHISEKGLLVGNNITRSKADYTILIAEDEEVNFLYLNVLLDGYKKTIKTIHAKNGKEAVELCLKNKAFDLVLMDIKMPVLNGLEATKQIKAASPEITVIAQTAYSTQNEKENAIKAGCNDFISKPIRKKEMYLVLEKYLQN